MLQLKNITKIYGEGEYKVNALNNVSINFRKSEFVSILGPSGCGKTTLLNIVGGLDKYTSGDLIINEVSTKDYKSGDWDTYRNNSIGFVFQTYNLIPHQTVLGNVELSLTLSGISKKERIERAKKALEKVGLKGLEHKLPNQMSGGQMQRVAIARALVNDPEIILADEPTGALDTETSIQIMEILKKISKDKLVIMVTHNPELAQKYSTRIINLLDGKIMGDTNPFTLSKTKESKKEGGFIKRSAMSFVTAIMLSLSNLRTKKARTTLTAIAGSIGIIGIALVLAVSTGFSAYINNLQSSTLSSYPLSITEATIDLSDFENLVNKTVSDEDAAQRLTEYVYSQDMFGDLTNMIKSNRLSTDYVNYLKNYINTENEKAKNTDKKWEHCLQTNYGFDVNNYIYSDISFLGNQFTMPVDQLVKYLENMFANGLQNSNMNLQPEFVRQYIPTMSQLPDNQTLIESQYSMIYGKWATRADEIMLVVDKYNRVSDITLALLGIKSLDSINMFDYTVQFGGEDKYSFEQIASKNFYYVTNNNRYVKNSNGSYYDKTFLSGDLTSANADMTLKVVGVLQLKEDANMGILDTGLAYTSAFVEKVLQDNMSSTIASEVATESLPCYSWYLKFDGNVLDTANSDPKMVDLYNSITGTEPADLMKKAGIKALTTTYSVNAREVAGDNSITKMLIYSVDYQAKEDIKLHMDAWNDVPNRAEEDKVHYSDSTAMLFFAMNSMVDAVKIVLICFTSISLVVSSIMIGIITYVSVVERTKEIGVLRAIGARKKDISRIFNAETFLIGLLAGLIGIIITYLLTIPINLIISSLLTGVSNLATLRVVDALILVVVSFALTLIAGIIPARIAAKKDPVVALRSE